MRSVLVYILFLGAASSFPFRKDHKNATSSCSCGWTNQARIVGGRETQRNEFPLIVFLEMNGRFICGGTIITPWHVVTAAHCTHLRDVERFRINFGSHHRQGPGLLSSQLERIIVHENFNNQTMANDISLLVSATEIPFTQAVGPACMPNRRLNLEGQRVKALGWGMTSNNGPGSNTLQQVDLSVIQFQKCRLNWKSIVSKENNFCTLTRGKGTCQGDSGGPLLITDPNTNRQTLVGMPSFGGDCAGTTPVVNTDISNYISWINRNINASRPGTTTCSRV